MTERFHAILPAAGQGRRLGAKLPKQYLMMIDKTMLAHSVSALLAADWLEQVLVVLAPDDQMGTDLLAGLARVGLAPVGGSTRRDSVLAGLERLDADANDWILVHDAARPGVTLESLEALRDAALDSGDSGALLALPLADTLKREAPVGAGRVGQTLSREGLWQAQTPQMFRFAALLAAVRANPHVTDEAAAMEAMGISPRLVVGRRDNFKVTTSDDFKDMAAVLGRRRSAGGSEEAQMQYRIGQGYDVHALVPGRPLLLGGVEIPSEVGLLGHSDADAVLHAITDAVLGAAGLGDIGQHFPDTNERWRGADSAKLLNHAMVQAAALGWRMVNLDASILAQRPRLASFLGPMSTRIASILGVECGCINIKARTGEKIGPVGRGECIEAQVVVMLSRRATQ